MKSILSLYLLRKCGFQWARLVMKMIVDVQPIELLKYHAYVKINLPVNSDNRRYGGKIE